MSATASLAWFAEHEFRLSWRDFLAMMSAGRRGRERTVVVIILGFVLVLHLVAYATVARFAGIGIAADKATLVTITGSALLSWSLMLSQAMESVTRAFYARSDLDLILSSPVAARKLFAVRILALAASIALMALLLTAPFINMLALRGGPRWLAAYGVVIAMGATAAAAALALTVALFRTIGPRRTRFAAQVAAAVIGAAFVIGLQAAAILSYGTLSRVAWLQSAALLSRLPDAGSLVWSPARAILGDLPALAAVMTFAAVVLGGAVLVFSGSFGAHAVAASGVAAGGGRRQRAAAFRPGSPARALRHKEWALLRRDPWLLSQTLMQVLYLLPPALLLWRSFGDDGVFIVLTPVLVMAAGQLAGGLAWLAICGEDAPDLIATAPVTPAQAMRAKIEAVMGGIALVFAPFALALALMSPRQALIAAAGIALAAASATAIQFWFRVQAKRSHFRRRQTSSRLATFAEAFSSITWAGAAALAAAGTWLALGPALLALAILAGTRKLSPQR